MNNYIQRVINKIWNYIHNRGVNHILYILGPLALLTYILEVIEHQTFYPQRLLNQIKQC